MRESRCALGRPRSVSQPGQPLWTPILHDTKSLRFCSQWKVPEWAMKGGVEADFLTVSPRSLDEPSMIFYVRKPDDVGPSRVDR